MKQLHIQIRPEGQRAAFTLTELLVAICLLAFWLCLLAPALGKTKAHSQDFVCLNNLRQLTGAMLMYTHDHHELFPPNPDDGNAIAGHHWCGGMAGTSQAQEFNAGIIKDIYQSLLAPYLNTNANLFHCAAELRFGTSTDPASRGTIVPAARSVSMNQAVGTICPGYNAGAGHSGIPNLPVNGPWLTGSYAQNHSTTGPWRTYGKTSDMAAPVPANLWLLTEENPWSMNDDSFAMSVGVPEWVDYPSITHNTGCVLAFGDGHSELHKWLDKTIIISAVPSIRPVPPADRDWNWLAARTSARVP